ncbi:hypothetical protein [Caldivirga maquilingensis]|uniref:Uncharacterized protein n=1 Tax=Caldivirga maquilingensis (strain ATCC 700844 / DSM 13496 / JCM 10307 / IC-167) TaxID=397948 RepID=A8M905_CALMQ|nr:hypothetical protein [Caldivirga maquilingensis]ABW02224.1 hypothetical protein Cmaq_1398 [Caldivirga maquilingensis IC-167]
MSTRDVRYGAVAGIGYSFTVSILTILLELLADVFYPVPVVISPLWAIYRGLWVNLLLILALYGVLLIFVKPYRSENLMGYNTQLFAPTMRIAAYTIVTEAILTVIVDSYNGPFRTRAGLFIVINIIAGLLGGYLGVKLSKP